MSTYRIAIFTWNTQSLRLCETIDATTAQINRSGQTIPYFGRNITSWQYSCEIPDFFTEFVAFLDKHKPDIVVIGFQEDRYPGSYFHSHLLPEEMPKIGFSLVKRTKMMGLGITSYNGFFNGDLFSRGVRVSIYVTTSLAPKIELAEKELRQAIPNDGQEEFLCSSPYIRGKGATVSYLCLPDYGRIAFICCHLPFNSESLVKERFYNNKMLRQTELNSCNVHFNNIVDALVKMRSVIPSHVFFFGDFNYRVADPRPANEVAYDFDSEDSNTINALYIKYDELKEQMRRGNIYSFQEGVDNSGPTFKPTYKLSEDRKWKTGKWQQRVPSWCDRILYEKFSEDGHSITCLDYDRFDHGTVMSKSDHCAVVGVYELK